VELDEKTGDLVVVSEDELGGGKLIRVPVDLVVLATGMVPATSTEKIPLEGLTYDEFGFMVPDSDKAVFSVGCAKRPSDVAASVQDATGTSLKAFGGKEVE
jgi:quinone-modifying oxidoreductase subunit QmoA